MIISSPFLLKIITKDEEIAVKTVDAAATETEVETTAATKTADKTQAVRRSDISLMIEVQFFFYFDKSRDSNGMPCILFNSWIDTYFCSFKISEIGSDNDTAYIV